MIFIFGYNCKVVPGKAGKNDTAQKKY